MKHIISLVLIFTLILNLSVSAFAVEIDPIKTYVPEIPSFISVTGNGGEIIPDLEDGSVNDSPTNVFLNNFFVGSYIILLEQWQYNQNKEEAGTDYDKKFVLTFVKPKNANIRGTIGDFTYRGAYQGDGYYIAPMRYTPSSDGYESVQFFYYPDTNRLILGGQVNSSSYPITFTYVVDSSGLAHSSKKYPFYDNLVENDSGKTYYFSSTSDVVGIDRHYNWWIGANGSIIVPPEPGVDTDIDTDGDGKPDLNIDSDKDGTPDLNVDTNGDGKPDLNIDTDKNGKPDLNIDTDKDGKPDLNIDTNNDKKPDLNVDTNGDGKPDLNIDTDKNGKPDLNIDTDKDGKPDLNIDKNNDKKPDLNIDTNGDGKPDLNIDTDKDGSQDINIDTNNDHKPDINIDTNHDNFPDINIDTNGDSKPDLNVDTNGDGKPDTNLKPDGGGGSEGGGDTSGKDWFPPDDNSDLTYDGFPIFDPFDYDNYKPPETSDPWNEYDPLEGFESGKNMPAFPGIPSLDKYQFHDPFKKPDWIK